MINLIKFGTAFVLAMTTFVVTNHISEQTIQVEASTSVTVKQGESIQSAIDSLKGGGTVYVEEGTYNEFITFNYSGTSSNPIIIKAQGNVVIDGQNKNGHLFDLNGKSYITIDGFTLTNLKGNDVAGIYLGGGEQHIQILNNEMYNFNKSTSGSNGSCVNGIILFGESNTAISDVLIQGNHLHDMDLNWSEALSVTGNAEYVNVINNKVHDMTNIGIDFCGNFGYAPSTSLDQPRHCVAKGNVIYNCNSPYATSYGLYCDGAYDILFENNIVYNCQGGIEVGAEEESNNYVGQVIVKNNLVYGCSENGLHVGGYDEGNNAEVKDVQVYNNTLVNNTEELFLSKCDNVELYNNIFYNSKNSEILYNEFSSSKTKNVSFHDNVYYTSGNASFYFQNKSYSQSTWLSSVESTALFQDPKLDSNYLPTSNTPSGKGYQAITTDVTEPETPEVVEPSEPEDAEEPKEPETPIEEPTESEESSEVKEGNLLPTLDTWTKETGLVVSSINGYDVVFTAPKTWTGLYLWGSNILQVGDTITVGVDSISSNAQFVIEDAEGNIVAHINSDNLSQTFEVTSSPLEIYITTSNTKEATVKGIYAIVDENGEQSEEPVPPIEEEKDEEQPIIPEIPAIPETPIDKEEEQTPPTVEEEQPVDEEQVDLSDVIIYEGAKYYPNNPTKKSASYFAKYDVLVFDGKYNKATNSSYEKMQQLIKDIQELNPDIVIVFIDKLS